MMAVVVNGNSSKDLQVRVRKKPQQSLTEPRLSVFLKPPRVVGNPTWLDPGC